MSLYREGLAICPDDDVAHYELGRALADAGRCAEAEKEFEAALKINPDFADARRQLDAIRAESLTLFSLPKPEIGGAMMRTLLVLSFSLILWISPMHAHWTTKSSSI